MNDFSIIPSEFSTNIDKAPEQQVLSTEVQLADIWSPKIERQTMVNLEEDIMPIIAILEPQSCADIPRNKSENDIQL